MTGDPSVVPGADDHDVPGMSERMRALLSGALGDREQLAGSLDGVQDRLDRVTTELGHLTEQVSALSASPREDDVAAASVSEVRTELEAMRLAVNRAAGAGAEHAAGLGELTDRVVLMGERVDHLGATLGDRDTRALESRLEVLQNDMTALGGEVAGLVEAAVQDRAEVRAVVEAAESAAGGASRVDELAEQLAEVRDELVGPEGLTSQVRRIALDLADLAADRENDPAAGVQLAIVESEARMRAHVDDAVYALAEALLRRRTLGAPGSAPEQVTGTLDPEPPSIAGAAAVPSDADQTPSGDHALAAVAEPSELSTAGAALASSTLEHDAAAAAGTAEPAPDAEAAADTDGVSEARATSYDRPDAGPREADDQPAEGPVVATSAPSSGSAAHDVAAGLTVDIDDTARTPVSTEVGQRARPARRVDVNVDIPAVRTRPGRDDATTVSSDEGRDAAETTETGGSDDAAGAEQGHRRWFRSGGHHR